MAIWGQDIQQVRNLANQLNQKANDIQAILAQLTSTLGSTQWMGPDANRFRNDWSGTHTAELKKVIAGLHAASAAATKNANEQQSTSA